MSKEKDEAYMSTRIDLNGAMAEYIKAAQEIGVDNAGIARDVCDSLFDASDGDIKLDATLEQQRNPALPASNG